MAGGHVERVTSTCVSREEMYLFILMTVTSTRSLRSSGLVRLFYLFVFYPCSFVYFSDFYPSVCPNAASLPAFLSLSTIFLLHVTEMQANNGVTNSYL
jgi:hypothetical protein